MIDLRIEPLFPNLYELDDLFYAHWKEVYGNSNPMPLEISFEYYKKAEDAGLAFGVFAYHNEIIIGYAVNFLAPNLHSHGLVTSNNDCLYVEPSFRTGLTGLKLIYAVERESRNRGASLIVWNSPTNSPLGKILPRIKYKEVETVFTKQL